jgi:hypothetical protein
VTDTPMVPEDADDAEGDERAAAPGDGSDRDEIHEGVEELLDPPPPEGGPVSDTDAEPTL